MRDSQISSEGVTSKLLFSIPVLVSQPKQSSGFCQHITLKFSKPVQVFVLPIRCWAPHQKHQLFEHDYGVICKNSYCGFFSPRSLSHSPDCSISSSEGHIYKTCFSDSLTWTVLHNYFSVSHRIILPNISVSFPMHLLVLMDILLISKVGSIERVSKHSPCCCRGLLKQHSII